MIGQLGEEYERYRTEVKELILFYMGRVQPHDARYATLGWCVSTK
jgi:hypothetical protein